MNDFFPRGNAFAPQGIEGVTVGAGVFLFVIVAAAAYSLYEQWRRHTKGIEYSIVIEEFVTRPLSAVEQIHDGLPAVSITGRPAGLFPLLIGLILPSFATKYRLQFTSQEARLFLLSTSLKVAEVVTLQQKPTVYVSHKQPTAWLWRAVLLGVLLVVTCFMVFTIPICLVGIVYCIFKYSFGESFTVGIRGSTPMEITLFRSVIASRSVSFDMLLNSIDVLRRLIQDCKLPVETELSAINTLAEFNALQRGTNAPPPTRYSNGIIPPARGPVVGSHGSNEFGIQARQSSQPTQAPMDPNELARQAWESACSQRRDRAINNEKFCNSMVEIAHRYPDTKNAKWVLWEKEAMEEYRKAQRAENPADIFRHIVNTYKNTLAAELAARKIRR